VSDDHSVKIRQTLMLLNFRLIRDALVERIWEGTTVILALDISRAAKDKAVLESFISVCFLVSSRQSCSSHSPLPVGRRNLILLPRTHLS
jgi:hypothetical protein